MKSQQPGGEQGKGSQGNTGVIMTKKTWEKYQELRDRITRKGQLLVALSGGVDSAFVAQTAVSLLGKNAVAATIDSEFFPKREMTAVKNLAHLLGIRHMIIRVSLLNDPIIQNPPLRCYHCKKQMAVHLWEIAQREQIDTIADGITQDDTIDASYHGITAWTKAHIWHPLAEVGLTRGEVRTLAHTTGLTIWDKPPESCLATRIPSGESITLEKLGMIDHAEDFLQKYHRQVRVRLHGTLARIEVPLGEISDIITHRVAIIKKLRTLGFTDVTLDLQGYRPGGVTVPFSPRGKNPQRGKKNKDRALER